MIYAIRNDDMKYQQLDLDIIDLLDHKPDSIPLEAFMSFEQNGLSLKEWWPNTLELDFYKPRAQANKIPDVSVWTGSTLVLSPRADRLIGEKLKHYGELLPFRFQNENWFLFNCLNSVHSDPDQTDYHVLDGENGSVKRLGFHDTANEVFIFKCPEEYSLTPFANEFFKNTLKEYEIGGVLLDDNLIEFPD